MSEPCRDKMGIIPDQRFENETVDVVPLKTFMSPEATPEFRAERARLKRWQNEMLRRKPA